MAQASAPEKFRRYSATESSSLRSRPQNVKIIKGYSVCSFCMFFSSFLIVVHSIIFYLFIYSFILSEFVEGRTCEYTERDSGFTVQTPKPALLSFLLVPEQAAESQRQRAVGSRAGEV
jgi:hypothetical protein